MKTIQKLERLYKELDAVKQYYGPRLESCFDRVLRDNGLTRKEECEKHIRRELE